ncbi:21518_t:CDS:2, partial [Gigaspora margarita]
MTNVYEYTLFIRKATGLVKDLLKSGALRIFTNRDKWSIIRLLVSGQCSNAVEIQKHLRIYENIEIYGSDGHQYCWKRPNEPFIEQNVIHTKKYGGGSVMDNDSKHTATDTKVWFYYNSIDLYVEIDDPDELWEAIQKVWAKIDMDYLNKLINSMPQQVIDIYNTKGSYTE